MKGDEVYFGLLPGFQHGARDPGRGIIAMKICGGPNGGNVNFSLARLAPSDARRAAYLIGSLPHMRAILHQWEERG